jgi:hypothetical protein
LESCKAHKGFVVVYEGRECPVCEIIYDNFRMRIQLLTNSKLSAYDLTKIPKYVKDMIKDIREEKKNATKKMLDNSLF